MVLQPLGCLVIEFLIDNFDALFQYEYTKTMEENLDVIAKGEKYGTNYVVNVSNKSRNFRKGLSKNVSLFQSTMHTLI